MTERPRRRWTDNEIRRGPFTYARERFGVTTEVLLSSGDEERPGVTLRLRAFGHTLIVDLPAIIKPYRAKVTAHSWSAESIARHGRNWYWNDEERAYGAYLSEGFLNVSFGRQSYNSSTEQRWGCFLPWTQWRYVARSFYGINGEHLVTIPSMRDDYMACEAATAAQPKMVFPFTDFDGEALTAITSIEEREWRFGTGLFSWLSVFRAPKIHRYLEIEFSGETGRRKGSWKGGTIGHSIEMLPGERHEAAFRRYCAEHEMTFGESTTPAGAAHG